MEGGGGVSKIHPNQVVFRFRPIERWTGAQRRPQSSRFKATGGQTQDDLRCELAAIGVRSCVIQADLDESDIRIDGLPRASARYRSPRVVVSFTHPQQGEVSFPSGKYDSLWCNVRAVVKTLEALRAVDRHGVTQRAEQYTGWKRLTSGGDLSRGAIVVDSFASVEAAARFLLETAGALVDGVSVRLVIDKPHELKCVYDSAARKAHPDLPTGSDALMARVNAARDMIRQHGGA